MDHAAEEREKAGEQEQIDDEEGQRPRSDDAKDGGVRELVGREKAAGFRDEVKHRPPRAYDLPTDPQRQAIVEKPKLR
jgi:hypothetical protein